MASQIVFALYRPHAEKDAALRQRYLQLGLEAKPSTPAEARAEIAAEIEKYARIIKDAGIVAEK